MKTIKKQEFNYSAANLRALGQFANSKSNGGMVVNRLKGVSLDYVREIVSLVIGELIPSDITISEFKLLAQEAYKKLSKKPLIKRIMDLPMCLTAEQELLLTDPEPIRISA